MNKGPWYNTAIYSRFHEILFEDFITHSRTDRYDIMCYLVAHDKRQYSYEDKEISLLDSLIPKNATVESLEALGDTLNFIEIWLKMLEDNDEVRSVIYNKAMKEMSKQIPITMIKSLSPKQKVQKIMTEIGGGWYMGKLLSD